MKKQNYLNLEKVDNSMGKLRGIPLFVILLVFCVSFVFANGTTTNVPFNKTISIPFTCTVNNQIPSASATYNISIYYPNGSALVQNDKATSLGQGSFTYNILFPSTGTYAVQSFCYDVAGNYSSSDYFYVSTSGADKPGENLVIFFSILFLIILFYSVYIMIHMIAHVFVLDFDAIDMALTIGGYIALLGVQMLQNSYLGDASLSGWIDLFISIGLWTHVMLPLFSFAFILTVGQFIKKKLWTPPQ